MMVERCPVPGLFRCGIGFEPRPGEFVENVEFGAIEAVVMIEQHLAVEAGDVVAEFRHELADGQRHVVAAAPRPVAACPPAQRQAAEEDFFLLKPWQARFRWGGEARDALHRG